MQTEHEPYDLASQEEAEAARKERIRLDLANEVEDYRWLMSGPRGRRIVRRFLAKTGLYRSSFDPNSDSQTAFHEGERNVGLRLTALLSEHFPAEYVAMLQENLSE